MLCLVMWLTACVYYSYNSSYVFDDLFCFLRGQHAAHTHQGQHAGRFGGGAGQQRHAEDLPVRAALLAIISSLRIYIWRSVHKCITLSVRFRKVMYVHVSIVFVFTLS